MNPTEGPASPIESESKIRDNLRIYSCKGSFSLDKNIFIQWYTELILKKKNSEFYGVPTDFFNSILNFLKYYYYVIVSPFLKFNKIIKNYSKPIKKIFVRWIFCVLKSFNVFDNNF